LRGRLWLNIGGGFTKTPVGRQNVTVGIMSDKVTKRSDSITISFKGTAIGKSGVGKSELLLTDLPTTPTFKPLNLIIQKHSFRSDRNHPESPGKCTPKDNVPTPTVRAPKLSPFPSDGKKIFYCSRQGMLMLFRTTFQPVQFIILDFLFAHL
jgi:hypothetical protein